MTIARIGDVVLSPELERCQGCARTALICEVIMDQDSVKRRGERGRCCGICTHHHDPATLVRYGQFD